MKHITKAIFSILLTLTLVLALTACGSDTSGLGTLEMGDTSGSASGDTSGDGSLEPLGGSDSQSPDTDSSSTPDTDDQTPGPDTGDSDTGSSDTDNSDTGNSDTDNSDTGNSDTGDGTNFVVDQYSCDDFECYIPQGWQVEYKVVDAGGGTARIYIFVQDPSDANNILYYISGMEPFFTSAADQKNMVQLLGDAYEWSPVLNKLSAEGVLEQWASAYTLMETTGFDAAVKYFKNYSIVSVLNSQVSDGASADCTTSQVLAEVSIPGASSTYGFLFADTLSKQTISDAGITYYISFDNTGFCLSADRFNTECQGMSYCLNSLNLSKFIERYGSNIGVTANDTQADGLQIDLPEEKYFED